MIAVSRTEQVEQVEQVVKNAISNYLTGAAVFVQNQNDQIVINVYDDYMLSAVRNLINNTLFAEKDLIKIKYKNSFVSATEDKEEYQSKDNWLSSLGDGRETYLE